VADLLDAHGAAIRPRLNELALLEINASSCPQRINVYLTERR
jgi:hypothetical protein